MERNKGFIPILIPLVIMGIVIVSAVSYEVVQRTNKNRFPSSTPNVESLPINISIPTSTPIPTRTPTNTPTPPKVGGGCSYSDVKGICTIVSIQKTSESLAQEQIEGGPGYKGYDVKFSFQPEGGNTEAKQGSLLLGNSWYPGSRFLEKYGISVGAEFSCTKSTIKTGTCSPTVFSFSTIDIIDYFETKPEIVELFACGDYCPNPREQYLEKVYKGITTKEECDRYGGEYSSFTGWETVYFCKVLEN